jgi:hypothetical protein
MRELFAKVVLQFPNSLLNGTGDGFVVYAFFITNLPV